MANNIDFIVRNGLQVMANVVVGSYATVNTAPVNGMIVSGNVGIGTNNVPNGNILATWGRSYNYGNIYIGNTGIANTTGIVFPDGTFQYTSASNAAAGDQYDVQLNNGSGSFYGDNQFQFDYSTARLGIGTTSLTNTMTVSGATPAFFQTTNGTGLFEILVGNTATNGGTVGYASGSSPAPMYLKVTGATDYGITVVNNGGTSAVGIGGINAPKNKLDVGGATVVGLAYAGVLTGPTNGLAVQGRVGIGTTTPFSSLDVNGGIGVRAASSFAGQLTVASLVSNAGISVASLTVSGDLIANSLTSNTNVVGANIQSTGQLSAASIVSNANITTATLNTTGAAQVSSLVSNNNITTATLNSTGATTVNSLNSNTNVVATNLQSTGVASVAGLISNTNITTSTLNASGALQAGTITSNGAIAGTTITGTAGTFTSIQNSGSLLTQSLNSNTNVVATNIQSTGLASLASLNVNAGITAQTLTTSGAAVVSSLTSNTTIQSNGAATFNSVTSNTSIAAASATITNNLYSGTMNVNGTLQAGNLASNGSVTGTSATITGNMYAGNLNVAGTETVNALIVNTSVQTATVNASSTIVGANIYSNGFVQAAGTVSAQSISSNTTITAGTGLTVTSGGFNVTGASTITGNLTVGNLAVLGTFNTVNSNVLVVNDPLIYLAEGNTGNLFDSGIVSNYNSGTYYHTGVVRNHNDGAWTIFDTLTSEPNVSTGNINWSDSTLTYGLFKAGNANIVGQTASTSTGTGALIISGNGGMGIGGRLNVGGSAWFSGTLNAGGTAIVNALTSNTSVTGVSGTFGSSLQAGATTVQSLNSNTNVVATNLQSTGTASVASLVSNGAITATTITGTAGTFTSIQNSGTTTVQSLNSNTNVVATNLQSTGAATVQSLNSNTNVVATNLQSTGQASVASLVSNGAISGTTINGTSGTFTSIQVSGTATVNALVSNVYGLFGQNLTVNSTNVSSLSSNGALVVAGGVGVGGRLNVAGNSYFTGIVNTGSNLIAQSINSNTNVVGVNLQSTGTASLASLIVNANTTTSTLNVQNNALVGSLNSNTNVVATNLQSTGTTTVDRLTANNGAVFGGNVLITNTTQSTSASTGALVVQGGVGIQKDLFVTGNITGSGATFFTGNSGVFYGDAYGFNALQAGIVGFTPLPQTVTQFSANYNGYAQINFENINSGNAATTDYIATAANGTDTTYYVDMGIAGPNYDNTNPNNSLGTAMFPNDSYLYAQGGSTSSAGGGNLVIGTNTPTKQIVFIAGGHDQANVAMVINEVNVAIKETTASINTDTGAFTVDGGVGINGNINVGGTRSTFTNRVGVGTSSALGMGNVFGVYGSTNLFGNLVISNTGSGSGIYFPDGTFMSTASANTPSFGPSGTVQFAGAGNTFSGNGANFFWDTANTRLGLGTNAPGSLLDVNGNASFRSAVSVAGTATVNALVSNTSVAGTQFQLNGNVATTSGITTITVDSFLTSAYRTAHYIVQITDNTASSYHSAQIMLIHDGTTVYKTEYNEIYTAGMLGNFDASISGGVLSLTFQANAATNKSIKMIRTVVAV